MNTNIWVFSVISIIGLLILIFLIFIESIARKFIFPKEFSVENILGEEKVPEVAASTIEDLSAKQPLCHKIAMYSVVLDFISDELYKSATECKSYFIGILMLFTILYNLLSFEFSDGVDFFDLMSTVLGGGEFITLLIVLMKILFLKSLVRNSTIHFRSEPSYRSILR